MDSEIKVWLYDILNAVHEVESFCGEEDMNFELYQADIKTKRAIERNIEIIGEAMNRILKKSDAIEISNARKFVDVRNRIIHGYDSVSDEIIWGIVTQYLPILGNEIRRLLNEV